jgi:hypothetical protein
VPADEEAAQEVNVFLTIGGGIVGSAKAERPRRQCRLHDLPHSFCTELTDASVPESTLLAIMGQMSRVMLERYFSTH